MKITVTISCLIMTVWARKKNFRKVDFLEGQVFKTTTTIPTSLKVSGSLKFLSRTAQNSWLASDDSS